MNNTYIQTSLFTISGNQLRNINTNIYKQKAIFAQNGSIHVKILLDTKICFDQILSSSFICIDYFSVDFHLL